MVNVAIFSNISSISNKTTYGTSVVNSITDINAITVQQLTALQEVQRSYTVYLAGKQFQNISSNYGNYINLLSVLNSINVVDPKLQILIKIAIEGLTGSINSISIFNQYAFKELAMIELNKRITDILSERNRIAAMNTVTSTMSAVKTINFSPLFSYYISLYGMPRYGIGFDPAKLAFIQNMKK